MEYINSTMTTLPYFFLFHQLLLLPSYFFSFVQRVLFYLAFPIFYHSFLSRFQISLLLINIYSLINHLLHRFHCVF
ncbi:hypothetical protein MtrunA17_Chr8g0383641 [Medicago truncatula]|uniref:Transmembrane protein n=1 Tax=Medicago truncatula TaxID=3880 RepID=A0A396GPM1_MEDTR|nr:hypothetical protein MtrunA17_Chr8g0383641 [Medicago truncatula]